MGVFEYLSYAVQDPHVAYDISEFFHGVSPENRDTEPMTERLYRPSFLTQALPGRVPSVQYYRLKYTRGTIAYDLK